MCTTNREIKTNMARKKLTEKQKKRKIGISIDIELSDLFDSYLKENDKIRSRYIESLIREDMKNRGFDTEPNF